MATYIELIVGDLPGFDPTKTKSISFKGQLDESNVDEQAKKVYQVLESAPAAFTLILNFAELEYMNSKAIGYLTDWYTRLSDKQGKIVIVQPRENILDILQVVGLTQLIQTYSTIDEARLALNQGAPSQPAAPTASPMNNTQIASVEAAAPTAQAAPANTIQPVNPTPTQTVQEPTPAANNAQNTAPQNVFNLQQSPEVTGNNQAGNKSQPPVA